MWRDAIDQRRRIGRALLWRTGDESLSRLLSFVVAIFLARLITPGEFGQFAMLAIFMGTARLLADGGFAAALIQRADLTHADECTVFWFNLAAGVLMAVILAIAAPLVAGFFQEPVLTPLLRVLAINLALGGGLTVPNALLSKQLRFKIQLLATNTAIVTSGAVAIWMAFDGYGVWALAGQALTATVVQLLVLWRLTEWRPAMRFSTASFGSLFSFGGFLLLSDVINIVATRLYTLVLGRSYSAQDVGIFYRAASSREVFQGFLQNIIATVAFPVFSEQAHDVAQLRAGLRTTLIASMALSLPMMIGLMLTAEQFVPLLFGPRWDAAIPILMVLCGLAALRPLHVLNLTALKSMGLSKVILKLELLKKALFITGVVIASRYSVMAVAWAMLGIGVVGIFINTWYIWRVLAYGFLRQFFDLAPYLPLTLVMAAAVVLTGRLLAGQPLGVLLVAKIGVGALSYLGLLYWLKLEALEHGLALLRQVRGRQAAST